MEKGRLNREICGVLICLTALLITLSLLTYNPSDRSLNTPSGAIDTHNWGGFIGAYLADLLLQGFGLSSYFVPILLCIIAFPMFRGSYKGISVTKAAAYTVFLVSLAVILALFIESENAHEAGGIVGGFLKESVLIPLFGRISATLITLFAVLLSLMLVTQNSLVDMLHSFKKHFGQLTKLLVPALLSGFRQLKDKREKRKGENAKKERRDYVPPPIVLKEDAREETEKKALKKTVIPPEQFKLPEISDGYKLPPPELLDAPEGGNLRLDTDTLHANSLILQKKLADFGVEGEVVAVRPGPVITMYEFKPAAGVKVRRIVTLADDLAMALRAVSVRILAPIPGESVVGIEIPNPRRETVCLREVIESEGYQHSDSTIT
ncbi:MAG: DNA translocase FtsK 4TM domain-containing protein, partial [Candidatus Binatia bacterium]